MKYFQKKYLLKIELQSDEKLIIPEYRIELLNKSKKVIDVVENINNFFKNKKSLFKNQLLKEKKELKKDKKKPKKIKNKKKLRTLWVRRKKTKLILLLVSWEMRNNFFFILPALKEFLPDVTASRKALAIKIGLFAFAIALFTRTPSQPNSIAMVASDGVPIPASTITGTLDCFNIKEILTLLSKPNPEPIGDASGIIAEAPISSSFFASKGSSVQ